MRPSFSIILFTVLSGAGYGLWMLVGVIFASQWPVCAAGNVHAGGNTTTALCLYPNAMTYAFVAGFFLVAIGLSASVGHLGKPLRAWRALSQWRSSWLSREGVSSLLTFLPAAGIVVYAWMLATVETDTTATIWNDPRTIQVFGAALVLGSLVTVYCTANIYACLKPVHGWNNRFVVPVYLLLAIYSGFLMFWAFNSLPDSWGPLLPLQETRLNLTLGFGIVILSIIGAGLKLAYWKQIDQPSKLTMSDATGLGSLGDVRSFEQPHTEENYLTHEMGFRIARKHAHKLRRICLLAGFAIPGLLALPSLLVAGVGVSLAWIALLSGMLGIFIERWLFFAEAKHAVMLYYR